MEINNLNNTGIYLRVSTERQVEKGFSLEAQRDNLTNFANEQKLVIYNYYIDSGISGKNIEDRPGVKQLINDIENKKINIVLLYKFDRLTRDSKDTELFIDIIKKYKVMVYTLSGGIVDISTPSGRFNTRILGAAAQFERETIIDRIVDGLIKKVKDGYTLCSATPSYGYDRPKNQKIQTINKEEAKIVKKIFKMYNDKYSIKEICDELNMLNIPTKKAGKKIKLKTGEEYIINSNWQSKNVRNILSNVNYIGKVRYGIQKKQMQFNEINNYKNRNKGFITDGLHTPIISKDEWNRAQEKLRRERKIIKTKIPKDDVYFCGKLYCKICNEKLTTTRTKKINKNKEIKYYNSYRCKTNQKNNNCCIGISHIKLEEKFLNFIDELIDLKEINKYLEINNSNKKSMIQLNNCLKKKENKKIEINKLFILNKITKGNYLSLMEELEKQILEIKKAISMNENNVGINLSTKLSEHWKFLYNCEKRKFIEYFIEKIEIENVNNSLEINKILFY